MDKKNEGPGMKMHHARPKEYFLKSDTKKFYWLSLCAFAPLLIDIISA
jgi:hypothetical protein